MNDTPADATQERSPLELVAFAAWVNCPVDKIPEEYRAPTCPHTMASWKRVADAILATCTNGLVHALQRALVDHNDRLRSAQQIAFREGADTNWQSFSGHCTYTLAEHQETVNQARAALASIEQPHD